MALFGSGYLREKYQKIKSGDEKTRLACIDFGLHALITNCILVALNVLVAVLLFATHLFDSGVVWLKGTASIVFGVVTAGYAGAGVNCIIWQKDLNARPIWLFAAASFALAVLSSLALAITGGVLGF